jgi:hypothetical protein
MADQAEQRQLVTSLEGVLREEPRTWRYRRHRRSMRRRGAGTANATLRQLGASALSVPARKPNFVERVARLLNPR